MVVSRRDRRQRGDMRFVNIREEITILRQSSLGNGWPSRRGTSRQPAAAGTGGPASPRGGAPPIPTRRLIRGYATPSPDRIYPRKLNVEPKSCRKFEKIGAYTAPGGRACTPA